MPTKAPKRDYSDCDVQDEYEEFWFNEHGELLLYNINTRQSARRAYSWVDRVLILEHNTIVKDMKFSELDLTDWYMLKPKDRSDD